MSAGGLCERFPRHSERPDGSSRPAFRLLGCPAGRISLVSLDNEAVTSLAKNDKVNGCPFVEARKYHN